MVQYQGEQIKVSPITLVCENYHHQLYYIPVDVETKNLTEHECKYCDSNLKWYYVNVSSGQWLRLLDDNKLEELLAGIIKEAKDKEEQAADAIKAREKADKESAEQSVIDKEEAEIKQKEKEKTLEKEQLIKEKQEKYKRVRELRKQIKDIESEKEKAEQEKEVLQD